MPAKSRRAASTTVAAARDESHLWERQVNGNIEFECKRCGFICEVRTPARAQHVLAISTAFLDSHRGCTP